MIKRKKIVHVSYYFHPEMGYDINLIGKHHSRDFDYVIITSNILDPWNTSAQEIKEKDFEFEEKFNVKIIRCSSMTPFNKHSVYMKRLRKTILAHTPDLVFFHGVEAYTYYFTLLTLPKNIKIFADTHTLRSQFKDMGFMGNIVFSFFKKIVVPRINKRPNAFFYTAPENKDMLTEDFGFDPQLIEDNEISVDHSVFYPKPADKSLIPGLKQQLTIGYVGKFDSHKEPHLIIEALKKMDLKQSINLLLIGPRDEKYMNKSWNEDGLNERISVFHKGSVKNTELADYYSLFDFLVIPKFNSLSSLDIQACAKPLIMENDATNALRCEKGGVLYKSNNIDDLARVITKLIEDDTLRESLSKHGWEYVKENYNYLSKLKRIENMY